MINLGLAFNGRAVHGQDLLASISHSKQERAKVEAIKSRPQEVGFISTLGVWWVSPEISQLTKLFITFSLIAK